MSSMLVIKAQFMQEKDERIQLILALFETNEIPLQLVWASG